MATIRLGASKNFDVSGLDLQTMIGTINDIAPGAGSLRLLENARNYTDLTGKFNFDARFATSLADVTKSITAIKAVANGHMDYSVTGLDMVKADVASKGAFTAYLAGEGYTIHGNNAANSLVSGNLADVLNGNGGNDILNGLGGRDRLNGGDNADHLLGGLGNDMLCGGSGIDSFIFADGFGADVIVDFNAKGKGHDIIDLSAVTGIDSMADIDIVRVKGGVEIDFGADSIFLKDVALKYLDHGDFIF
jgi:Ca2+-binding RTX toxin-like protein